MPPPVPSLLLTASTTVFLLFFSRVFDRASNEFMGESRRLTAPLFQLTSAVLLVCGLITLYIA